MIRIGKIKFPKKKLAFNSEDVSPIRDRSLFDVTFSEGLPAK